MSSLPDPIRAGIERGWKVLGGRHGALPESVACDVAIVGTGAGAGITAELLTAAGLSVVLIEEGPLRSSRDFNQIEAEAYPALYQDSANRQTADKAISILQGRCVGGSTTVNWTSSFRTPSRHAEILARPLRSAPPHRRCDVALVSAGRAAAEHRRLAGAAQCQQRTPAPWSGPAGHLRGRDSAQRQGLLEPRLLRHGLPDQRQAVDAGDDHSRSARPRRHAAGADARRAAGHRRRRRARACCACRWPQRQCRRHTHDASPGAPRRGCRRCDQFARRCCCDPRRRIPTACWVGAPSCTRWSLSTAIFDEPIEGWHGAPQTIYSDHFLGVDPIDGADRLQARSAAAAPGAGLDHAAGLRCRHGQRR